MSLQSKYRNERHDIHTFENDEFYFAYKIINDEFHVEEIYIDEKFRGDAQKYFKEIYNKILLNKEIKYIVCTVVPRMKFSDICLKALLKFGFKMLKTDSEKLTLYFEVING